MLKVLIICTGNAIRSQMAEAYLNFYAHHTGIFFSAGLEPTELSPYAVQVMAEDNIDLSEHLLKSLKAFQNITFDHVLTVCEEAEAFVEEEIEYEQWHHHPVPDPQVVPDDEEATLAQFRKTRDQIKIMILKFIGKQLLPHTPPVIEV